MTNELRTSYIVDLSGNLVARSQRFNKALGRFSSDGRRHFSSLTRYSKAYGKTLDRLGNRYTALIAGGGLTLAARQVGSFNDEILALGIQAGISDEKLKSLKQQIFSTAENRNILVDPDTILAGVGAIVEKTGDLKFAQENIENIGLAIRATGAEGGAIGEILAEFQKMGITAPREVMKALDVLNVQGKEGAFTLKNIAALGPRVITAYTAMGRTGVPALREMGAALQVIRQGTGSSEMAATAFEAVMRTLADPQKIKQLEKLSGIGVFDPEKLEEGKKVLRPINEIMEEIVQKTKGDLTKIGLIFDAEAVRAFNSSASEFQRTGAVTALDKFYNVQADGTQTMLDSQRAATGFGASMSLLTTAGKRFADNNLAQPVKELAHWLNSVDAGTVQRWLELGKQVALIGGGLILANKARRGFASMRGGAGGAKGGAGGLAGSMTPIPVYIVGGGAGVSGNALTAAGGSSKKGGRLAKMGGALGKAGILGEVALASYGIGSILNEAVITPLATWITGRENSLGTSVADFFLREQDAKALAPVDIGGTLKIKIDQEGRAKVAGLDEKGGLAIVTETGRSMGVF